MKNADLTGKETVAGVGEDRLIEIIRDACQTTEGPAVLRGIGDDCALLERGSGRVLFKTDAVVEGIHFLPDTNPARVGAKAMKRVLSDIAASGGVPGSALVTLGVCSETRMDWVSEVYAGLVRTAHRFGVSIVGGETVECPGSRMVSIAMLAEVGASGEVPGRGGARRGDAIFVTGALGGSFASEWHLDFEPRLAEGQWLVGGGWVRAMMDVSDGLGRDLGRMARRSGCGFRLRSEWIPVRPGFDIGGALRDGEDFELLMAVPSERAEELKGAWASAFPELALSQIGEMVDEGASDLMEACGVRRVADEGWEHFTKTGG